MHQRSRVSAKSASASFYLRNFRTCNCTLALPTGLGAVRYVGSTRGEFLEEFLEVAEHYAELVRDASDARQLKIRRNCFAREGSLSHD